MKLSCEKNVVLMQGVLNEAFPKDAFRKLIASIEKQGYQDATIDFGEMTRASSVGLNSFLQGFGEHGLRIYYRRCPYTLVAQFNTVDDFFSREYFPKGVKVLSIELPFTSEDGEFIDQYVELGKDIPIQDNYDSFEVPPRIFNGETFKVAVDLNFYFSFVKYMDK